MLVTLHTSQNGHAEDHAVCVTLHLMTFQFRPHDFDQMGIAPPRGWNPGRQPHQRPQTAAERQAKHRHVGPAGVRAERGGGEAAAGPCRAGVSFTLIVIIGNDLAAKSYPEFPFLTDVFSQGFWGNAPPWIQRGLPRRS